MDKVWMDDEFASECDIKLGAFKYHEHPSTHFLCKGYFHPSTGLRILKPHEIQAKDQNLVHMALDPNCCFVAHNAIFERVAWKQHMVPLGYPDKPINQWRCTMAKAWFYSLPGKLKLLAEALELRNQKQDSERIKTLFKPKKGKFIQYEDDPALYEELYRYNAFDITTMVEADLRLPDIPAKEQRLWEIDQRMNEHGIMLDMPLVHRVQQFIDYYTATNNRAFEKLTGIPRISLREQFGDWLHRQGYTLGKTPKGKWDTSKDSIKKLLARGVTHEWVKEAIRMFQANKSSLSKYEAMVKLATDDGLLREILAYHAAHTGRYGGRGVQLQNLPRPVIEIKHAIECIVYDYHFFKWVYEGSAA